MITTMKMNHNLPTVTTKKQYQRPTILIDIADTTMLCLSGEEEGQTETFTVNESGRLSDKYWD